MERFRFRYAFAWQKAHPLCPSLKAPFRPEGSFYQPEAVERVTTRNAIALFSLPVSVPGEKQDSLQY